LIRRGLTEFAARAGVTDLGDDDRLVDAPMAEMVAEHMTIPSVNRTVFLDRIV